AEVTVLRRRAIAEAADLLPGGTATADGPDADMVETRLIGLRQQTDGVIRPCPLEHLLLLRGATGVAPGSIPLARLARGLADGATEWLRRDTLGQLVEEQRARIAKT